MKHVFLKFGLLFFVISFTSCDGFSGMDGIVKDSETGQLLEGVKVEMTSHYKTINTITNELGEFYASHAYSCGIIKCTECFTIKFEKDGYEILERKDCYRGDKVVIELIKLESESE